MKAAQFFAQGDVRVVDIPKPVPNEHEALVAIEWSGICGSDLHEYEHGPNAIPPPERPDAATGESMPVTMGHEFAGRIVSAPLGSGLKSGQPVIVDPRIYCGTCTPCTAGSTNGCKTLGFKGLSGTGGGFSEAIVVDAKQCYPLPEDADLSLAPLIEPIAVAWHAVTECEVSDWSTRSVLVIGGGPIGIACALALRARGCKQIYISEPTTARAVQNRQVADVVFNPINDDIGAECRERTSGEGVDIVFDCAGVQRGFDAGMDALRFKGLYMNVSAWVTPMIVPFIHFIRKEITTKASLAYTNEDFEEVVEAFKAGKLKGVETMVSSRIYLDDITNKGFNELVHRRDRYVKIMVTSDRSKVL